MGMFSSLFDMFQGDPKFNVLDKTKNNELQTRLEGLMADYDATKKSGETTTADFIAKWIASNADAERRGDEEVSNLDRFYDGGVRSDLAGMRTRRQAATTAAGEQALKYATRNRNLSQLLSGGGQSSYDTRLGMKNANDILIKNALDDSNQERQDYGWLEENKLRLTGKRQNILDTVLQRILVPNQIRQSQNNSNLGFLQNWQGVNNNNKFYGLQQPTSFLTKFGNFFDENVNTVLSGMSILGGGGGRRDGGGRRGGGGRNWQPDDYSAAAYGPSSDGGSFDTWNMN